MSMTGTHTHEFKAYKNDGGFVNPGSAPGACCNIIYHVNPRFMLMDIDGLCVVV